MAKQPRGDVSIGKFDILATYAYAQALVHGKTDDEAKQRGMVAAIAAYALFHSLKLHVPTIVVLYVFTMPLGFFFFRSLWLTIRPRNA